MLLVGVGIGVCGDCYWFVGLEGFFVFDIVEYDFGNVVKLFNVIYVYFLVVFWE